MATLDQELLQTELKKKRICRFCLSQVANALSSIYYRDTRIKSSAPLPIQIMAIASIEVFSNDGMPSFVCSDCISMFEYSYQFKQMCKKADNLLRQYPLTGKWPDSLEKPSMPRTMTLLNNLPPKQNSKITQIRIQPSKQNVTQESLLLPKKILNVGVEGNDKIAKTHTDNYNETVTKVEKSEEECNITFLDKIDNNDELSIDDIQLLVASEDVAEEEFVKVENMPLLELDPIKKARKPKLLNKSSVRILNKDANRDKEPRLSLPKIKKSQDGNMEIVAEILSMDEKYEEEPDPKNAEPIETNVFPCPHCERTFPLVQLRDIHLKNHYRDRKFQCDECDKSFFSKYDLQRHSFIHNGEKPYKCSACDKAFSRTSLLTRHEKIHTDVPKYICVHCERSFISKEDLDKHAERHNISRPYQCKICNKGFAYKQGLERHEAIHSRQQPNSCKYCEQSFSNTTKLARHLTAHAGLRPYPCKFCKKSYLLSHHLTRHMRSHKNIDNLKNVIIFKCSTCNTNFESRDELINHSKTHTDERNLACPLCKETYDDMNSLTAHIQDHSEGEAYACEFCDLIFMTAQKLQLHTDIDHAQEMEAYHADDRAQADKKNQESQKQEMEISDENFQSVVNEFLTNDYSDNVNDPLKLDIKTEKSPVVIKQIIIRGKSGTEEQESNATGNQVDENHSLLIPLKQRKIDKSEKKTVVKPLQKPKQSPQLKRKTPNATSTTPVRTANQPTIQTLLKMPKGVTETKTTTPNDSSSVQKPMKVKEEKNASPPAISTASKTIAKKVKVQKITVTKAEAAAMAKDGRIKIKDGKMILNTEKL